jgi:hypothetical protein
MSTAVGQAELLSVLAASTGFCGSLSTVSTYINEVVGLHGKGQVPQRHILSGFLYLCDARGVSTVHIKPLGEKLYVVLNLDLGLRQVPRANRYTLASEGGAQLLLLAVNGLYRLAAEE